VTAELATLASRGGRLAIDTEFMSEGRYRALLCLAQVAVPDSGADGGVRTEVLDPLVDALDPRPVAAALADPAVEVTVHAGRQDIAILRRAWRTDVTNVFDTQVAAGFVGFGPQERYESLVRSLLGVKLGGSEGFTRWDRRPLTGAAGGSRPAGVGARGVPAARALERPARPRAHLSAAAPRRRAALRAAGGRVDARPVA
jgi:ribonuclease D